MPKRSKRRNRFRRNRTEQTPSTNEDSIEKQPRQHSEQAIISLTKEGPPPDSLHEKELDFPKRSFIADRSANLQFEPTKPVSSYQKINQLIESNLFWGGGIAFIAGGYGSLVTANALWLAGILISIGWLMVSLSIINHKFFERKSRKKQLFYNGSVSLAIACILGLIFLAARLVVPPESKLEKEAPSTPTPIVTNLSDEQLERIEFRTESAKAIKEVIVIVKFNRTYSPYDIGHFRALFEISSNSDHPKGRPALIMACRDLYQENVNDDVKINFGLKHTVYSRNPSKQTGVGGSILGPTVDGFDIGGDLLERRLRPFSTLDDLNGKDFQVYLSESLIGKVSEISLIANNYILISAKSEQFVINHDAPRDWILPLTKSEKSVGWSHVLLKLTGAPDREADRVGLKNLAAPWQLDFTLFTPSKFQDKTALQ
jgi:hypothetical protein